MPDLQSELSKVISTWSEPEVNTAPTPAPTRAPRAHNFVETKGTSRAVFDYILSNPGQTRQEIYDGVAALGHSRPTVQTLVTQMIRQKRVTETDSGITSNYNEYTPLKAWATWLRMEQKAKRAENTKAARAAKAAKDAARAVAKKAVKVAAVPEVKATPIPAVVAAPEFNAETFVNSLTLKQAKAVYEELKKVFE